MEVPDDLQENLLNESENEINEDKQPTSKTKKERERFRLAFASLMLFGHYFAYDSIGKNTPRISPTTYSFLTHYTFGALTHPNSIFVHYQQQVLLDPF